MQGTRVRALVREDPTCRGATKPVRHDYWACTLEPACRNYWSPCATTTEARAPRAHVPQQEKPPQWEACATQRRVAPARRTQRKPARSKEDPMQPKIKNKIKYINLLKKKKNWLRFFYILLDSGVFSHCCKTLQHSKTQGISNTWKQLNHIKYLSYRTNTTVR